MTSLVTILTMNKNYFSRLGTPSAERTCPITLRYSHNKLLGLYATLFLQSSCEGKVAPLCLRPGLLRKEATVQYGKTERGEN